jgi:DNA-binding GntR family transcriptional regulator
MESNLAEKRTYETLKEAIILGKLPPNYHLVESDLAEAMEVGRQTVRLALRLLEKDRLVKIIPYKGAFVSIPTSEEVTAAFIVRQPLEGTGARLAAERIDEISEDEIDIIEDILKRESEAYKDKKRLKAYKISGEFHVSIARLSGNEFIYKFVKEIIDFLDSSLMIYDPFKVDPPHSPRAHTDILNIIKSGNGRGSEKAMIEHLGYNKGRLDFTNLKPSGPDLKDILKR